MDFIKLTVGERFQSNLPDEGMSVLLNGGAPILVFKFTVSERDIDNFLNGAVSFGLFADANVIFFLFNIDGFLDWSDLAFTIHLAQGESVDDDGSYLPFHLVLLESGTSIVKGLRVVTASPAFRSVLAKQVKRQAAERFDTVGYYQAVGGIYESYPSAALMLKTAVIIERGGLTFSD
ncbi:hypothetical protein [Candidatus Methylomicrobium oryzae]|uniref:hypothetical protein n=1 Tax=Candidatus Methylomicrobium oryzae TaxID=2802053 RepID=UPI0019235AEE|nr:hypothetical protein [Methylomicrobium sp. RS1]MBL1265815.1 hypothetical protein [Methylomicrobium sp. RS1]